MKTSNYVFRFFAVVIFFITLLSAVTAQRGHYHKKHGNKPIKVAKHHYDNGLHNGHRFAYKHFGPAYGFRVKVLPLGYTTIRVGRNSFYFYDGVYYQPYNNGIYEVIAPPLGAVVHVLPVTSKTVTIGGQKYFQLGGTFYQENINGNKSSYIVVGINGVLKY